MAGALAERASRRGAPGDRGHARAAPPGRVRGHGAAALRGLAAYAGIVRPTGASALNGPIGRHRRWDWAAARLSDIKEIRAAFGGTVNDVVLAVIAHGFRELLEHRGEPTRDVLRTLVPVSVRAPGDHEAYNSGSRRCSPTCRWASPTRWHG